MNDQVSEKIVEIVEKLGNETDRIWPQLVAYTWAWAVFWSVAMPILFIAIILADVAFYRWQRRNDPEGDNLLTVSGFLVLGCFTVFIAFAMLTEWPRHIITLFYPEAETIRRMFTK